MLTRDHFYDETPISNEKFPEKPTYDWEFLSYSLLFQNDSQQIISYSFNGTDLDGTIKPSDRWLALDNKTAGKVWLRTSKQIANGSAFRLTVWRKEPS